MAAPYDLEQLLVSESGRIGADIYRRTVDTSVFLKLVSQEAWPDEMGSSIKVMTYERSLPVNADTGVYTPNTWTAVGENTQDSPSATPPITNDGDNGGNCVPTALQVKFGQSLVSYNLVQTALESPDICVNDLRFPVYRKQQLANIMQILTENTSYLWIERFRDEYIRLAGNKTVANIAGGLVTTNGATFPVGTGVKAPDSQLTLPMLKRAYMRMIRDGAGTSTHGAIGRENGRPVFTLILSSEASENLILLNAELRQDVRWSTKVADLLSPLGVERSYQGFYHLIDDFAPRYNATINGSNDVTAYTRVYPYIASAATKGKKLEINPAYETATYEDVIIFHPDVFVSMVPKPITSPGGGTSFDPVNYRGDFHWQNIRDRVTNPDGTIGYFRGVFQSGSKPIFPQYGTVIRVLRGTTPLGTALV